MFNQPPPQELYPHEYEGPPFDWPPYREVLEFFSFVVFSVCLTMFLVLSFLFHLGERRQTNRGTYSLHVSSHILICYTFLRLITMLFLIYSSYNTECLQPPHKVCFPCHLLRPATGPCLRRFRRIQYVGRHHVDREHRPWFPYG